MLLSKQDTISFMIGMLYGDGHLSKGKYAKNYNLGCTHNPKQYDYLIWKMNTISETLGKKYWVRTKKSHFGGKAITEKNKGKEYLMYVGTMGTHTLVTKMHNLMYNSDNKKIATLDILRLLTPIGLAIWYMDDGNLAYKKNPDGTICSREVSLHIEGLDYKSQNCVQQYFQEDLGLDARLHKARDSRKLWMNTTNSKKFIEIVKPYVELIDCMRYKIDMKYHLSKNSVNAE